MDKQKNKKEHISLLFLILAIAFSIVIIILYPLFGATIFNPQLDFKVIVFLVVSVLFSIVCFFLPSKFIKSFPFFFSLLSFLYYVNTQITYIANVFVGIDKTTFSFPFITTVLSFVFSMVFSILSMTLEEQVFPSKKGEKACN